MRQFPACTTPPRFSPQLQPRAPHPAWSKAPQRRGSLRTRYLRQHLGSLSAAANPLSLDSHHTYIGQTTKSQHGRGLTFRVNASCEHDRTRQLPPRSMRPISARHPVSYTLSQNLPEGARPAGCPSRPPQPMGARRPVRVPMSDSALPLTPRPLPPRPTPPRDDALTAAFWNFHSRPRSANCPGERAGGAERARARESSVTPAGEGRIRFCAYAVGERGQGDGRRRKRAGELGTNQ